MTLRQRLLFAGVLGALLTPQMSLSAQGTHPELAGHTFVPSTLLPDPFVETYLSTVIGLGSAFDYDIAWPVLGEDTLFLTEGSLTWVTVDFDYRQRVTDWLALGGQVIAGARVGTNAASAISDGVSVATGVRIGGVARLVRSRPLMVSAHLDVARKDLTLLNILGFAEEVIDSVISGGRLDSLSIAFDYGAWRGHGGLRVAYTPTRLLGISAMADVAVGKGLLALEESQLDVGLGASVDFNFHSAGWIPLGVVLAYRFGTFAERSEGAVGANHRVMLGVSYMGHADYSVGLEVHGGSIDLPNSDAIKTTIEGIRMRYYF
jgi:hypothetical protein